MQNIKGFISNSFITSLIADTDIISFLSSYISLKKTGKSHSACCPFHNEKSPSFFASKEKQVYHCFGCGASGNIIAFIMEYNSLSFVEAIEELAEYKGVEVVYENKLSDEYIYILEQTNKILVFALNHFHFNLKKNTNALLYLKNRNLNLNTIKDFSIGYADMENSFYNHFIDKNYDIKISIDLGILNTYKKDYFQNRIMFPIKNKFGKILGFGGRSLSDEQNPKYLNSQESNIFKKGDILYGLYENLTKLKSLNKKPKFLVVVEGFLDVISLYNKGFFYAVASLGTSLSFSHINKLFKETDNLIFCFDGDRAGKVASIRLIELILPLLRNKTQIKILLLKDNLDPDEFINKFGFMEWKKELKNSLTIKNFIWKAFNLESNDFEKKQLGLNKVINLISKLKDKNQNSIYIDLLKNEIIKAFNLDINEQLKFENFNKNIKYEKNKKNSFLGWQKNLLSLCLSYPNIVKENFKIESAKIKIVLPLELRIIITIIILIRKNIEPNLLISKLESIYKEQKAFFYECALLENNYDIKNTEDLNGLIKELKNLEKELNLSLIKLQLQFFNLKLKENSFLSKEQQTTIKELNIRLQALLANNI